MKNRNRSLLLALIIVLAISSPVSAGCLIGNWFGCSLDTKGTLSATCNTAKLTDHSLTASKHTYTFNVSCSGASGDEAANFYMVTVGEWNLNGLVSQHMYNKYNTAISGTVTAKCKYDPWIFPGSTADNPCTITDTSFSVPSSGLNGASALASDYIVHESVKPPFCSSCSWIPQSQKQQYWTQASSMIPVPVAPIIELPAHDISIFNNIGKVAVRIKHDPNAALSWRFQAYNSYSKGPNFWFTVANPAPPLINSNTSAGVTTGDLNLDVLKGHTKIRFQVASVFPGAPWSEWRAISLTELMIQQGLPK